MPEFYANASNFVQMIIILALSSTFLIVLQVIMLLVGLETDDIGDIGEMQSLSDMEGDTISDVAGMKLVTLRGVIIFIAAGSWMYLILYSNGISHVISLIAGAIAGVLGMYLFAYAMKKILEIQEEGNVKIDNSVGKHGIVYLKIPANRNGNGKINVLVQERLSEFDAQTDDDKDIVTGSEVEIVGILNNILIVTKIKK
ncbi:NfeD family protein [Fusobacterium sp. PH5-44]|uniref:NfeD family protein n=1 Tax=unclassified Fusobacterium TaxID=2648384 RepID=UPI003D1BECE7